MYTEARLNWGAGGICSKEKKLGGPVVSRDSSGVSSRVSRSASRSQSGSPESPPVESESSSPGASRAGQPAWTRIDLDSVQEAIDPIELQEFLEADRSHIQANPVFKNRLRGQLWRLIQSMQSDKEGGSSSS